MTEDAPRRLAVSQHALAIALCGTAFSPPLTNVALLVTLIALISLPDAAIRLRRVMQLPLVRAALLLLLVLTAALLWAHAPWPTRWEALSNWRILLLMLIPLAVFDTPASKARLAAVFVIFACASALISFLGWGFNQAWLNTGLPGTVLRNPSTQSMVFVAACALAIALAQYTTASQSTRLRALWYGAAGLIALNLLFVTTGRSGQVALVLVAATYVLSLAQGRIRAALFLGLPVAVGAVIALSPVVQQRFAQGWHEMQSVSAQSGPTSMGMRVVIWDISWSVVQERPWLGHGLGGFDAAYARHAQAQYQDWRATPTHDPHNQYLFILASTGFVGLVVFLGFLITAAWQPAAQPWKACALALLAAWSTTSLLSSHFQTFAEGHLIALLLGTLLAPRAH